MAREMNVEKRVKTLSIIVEKTKGHQKRLTAMAKELSDSFKADKSPKGKQARLLAQVATRLGSALDKAAANVKL